MGNELIECDTTLGNVKMSIPKPKKIGQRVTIKNNGNGLVYIEDQIVPMGDGIRIDLVCKRRFKFLPLFKKWFEL